MKLEATTLSIKQLSDFLAVSPQLQPQDMHEVARIGFKSVIINLPDFELDESQVTAEEIINQAHQAGLEIVYQPVVTANINENDAKKFGELVERLPKPVLAFCRSGNRCSILFNLYQES